MQPLSKEERAYIEELMSHGIEVDPKTGIEYYTGYEYKALYDWDQYFETLIELKMGWTTEYAINGIRIFLEHQHDDGFIPRTTPDRLPENQEHVKPFLAQIALLCLERDGQIDYLDERYYTMMVKYLCYWLEDLSDGATGLSWWNSAPHSGMDNQHERAGWWGDAFGLGVDLNCFLVRECRAMAKIADLRGKVDDAQYFRAQGEKIKQAINEYLWDEKTGFYYDRNRHTGERIMVKSSGAFSALWAKVASVEQAKRMVEEHLTNEKEFWRPFPVSSYAADEAGYSEDYLEGDLGCNWRANTWVPVNYYIAEGLRDYGYDAIAKEICDKTRETVKRIGSREYYTSETVQGCGLNPFWGWTLLAYFM